MNAQQFSEDFISASSAKPGKEAKFARVSYSNEDGIPPSWSPRDNDTAPYLTVTFKKPVTINSIITQGGGNGEFVKIYHVSYVDADTNERVDIAETPPYKVFNANTEDKESVENMLDTGITVKAITIYPLHDESEESISMRVEYRGCEKTVSLPTTAIVHTSKEVETTTSTPIVTKTQPGMLKIFLINAGIL